MIRELQVMIYEIMKGIDQWSENKSEIPAALYRGHLRFMKFTALNGGSVPADLHYFIGILQKPSREWGIHEIDKVYDSGAALLDEYIGFTLEAEDFMNSFESPDEDDQNEMKKILNYCRKHQLDKGYVSIRTFLSNPEHAVIDAFSLLESFPALTDDKQLNDLIFQCYEELPQSLNNYRKCPYCGWTLEWKKGNWQCNKENICHHLKDFEKVRFFEFNETERIYRMKRGIQRYVLLPGMQEISLANQLRNQGYQVELYPEIDLFDLRIYNEGKAIDVDVKDYRSPALLANTFNQMSQKQLAKYHHDSYVVIPYYRSAATVSYTTRFYQRLDKPFKDRIKLLTVNEFKKRLREGTL